MEPLAPSTDPPPAAHVSASPASAVDVAHASHVILFYACLVGVVGGLLATVYYVLLRTL